LGTDAVITSALKHLSELSDGDNSGEDIKQFIKELAMLFDKTKYTRKEEMIIPSVI